MSDTEEDDELTFAKQLRKAAYFGDAALVHTLVASGAEINWEIIGNDAIVFLLDQGIAPTPMAGMELLHFLCWGGFSNSSGYAYSTEQVLDRLVDAGISLEARDDEGRTALHWTVDDYEWFSEAGMLYLLRRGANPNARDIHGQTPLHIAASRLSWQARGVAPLIGFGADARIRDRSGRTPIELMRRTIRWKRTWFRVANKQRLKELARRRTGRERAHYRAHYQYDTDVFKTAYAAMRASLRRKPKRRDVENPPFKTGVSAY